MRTKNELYQEALRTIAARRQTARALAEDARAEAEAVIPALRHAEEEVRVRGIRCALAGAAGKDRTAANAALTEAKQKLAALLAASGRCAGAKIHLQKVPGHWRGRRAHLQLCPQGDAGPPPERDRGAFQPVHFQL